ncbi:MAG: SAM-dependent methyltransferase [Actinomycetota bacterium]
MTGRTETLAGSFRDPSGFVFSREGDLYRQVNLAHRADYDLLLSSGLYDSLLGEGLLIPHEEVDVEPAAPGAYKVLRPEPVTFVSYPYEWSFSQLRDAARITLRIQSMAMDHGLSLRDASAYNVQFHAGRPVLIDTLSLGALPEGRPWVAYRQFCEQFLAPLALMSYRDVRLGQLLRVHLDGVPLDLAVPLLPRRIRMRAPLLIHLVLHAKSQRRHGDDTEPAASRGGLSPRALRGLIDSLRSGVEGLALPGEPSEWRAYDLQATHYSDEEARRKEELVSGFIEHVRPATVWDLGANVGRFSRLASRRGIPTIAFDIDPACVDESYRRARSEDDRHLLPLVLDLANPSPGIGWANAERMTLEQRGPADLCLALALVHHLAIGRNVPLPRIADLLTRMGRWIAVEFVSKEDERVAQLLLNREDVFPEYTEEGFEQAMTARFEILRREPIRETKRTLYLLRRREGP